MTWEEYKKKNKINQNNTSTVQSQKQIAPINKNIISSGTTSSWEEYKKKNNITQKSMKEQEEVKQINTNENVVPAGNNITKLGIGSAIKSQLKEVNNQLTDADLKKLQAGDKETLEKVKQMSYVAPKIQKTETDGELRTLKDNSKFKDKNGKIVLEEDGFFKSSNANITQKILGTVADVGFNVAKEIGYIGENLGDLASYGVANVAEKFGADEYADRLRRNAQSKNYVDKFTQPIQEHIDNMSVLGNKSKEIAQGLGYIAGNTAAAIFTGGVAPASASAAAATTASMTMTFTSSMGGGMTEAYQEGANDEEAFAYGLVSGLGETGSELLFGGLGKGTKALGLSKGIGGIDDQIAVGLTKNIKNKMAKTLIQAGVKSAGEGAEEVVSGFISAVGKKVTYMKEEELGELIKDQNLWEQFCMGALTSAIAEAPSVGVSIKNGTDYVTLDYEGRNNSGSIEKGNNTQEQQTISTNTKTASTIENNTINNIKAPIKELSYSESARKYNLDTNNELVQSIDRVTNERGIKARYDADIFTDTTQNAIWRISKDENNNTIREVIINPNADSKKSLENIIVHELTHDLEGTKEHKELRELLLNYDKGKFGYEESRQALENLYSKVYDKNSVEFNELIDNEAVADILGSKLGDQDFINSLNVQNKTLTQRIYSWVVDKLNKINKLTGYKSEKLYWTDVKNKFENAFKQEYQANNNNELYSISGKTGMNNLIKNNPQKYIELEQAYNKAQQLKRNGVDNETIRQQTRWFQDKNGDWKFEFSDKDMSLKKDIKLQENTTYKLGDILEHDTLFMAYPELANYNVEIKNIKSSGVFDSKTNTIRINSEKINDKKSIEGTLIHEIQHAIQNIENFEKGASVKKGRLNYYKSLGEIEASNTKERFINEKYDKKINNIAPESSKANPKHKNLDNYLNNRKGLDKLRDYIYNDYEGKGGNNEISEEYMEKNMQGNKNVVDGRKGRRYLKNKQEANIKYSIKESENNSGSFNLSKKAEVLVNTKGKEIDISNLIETPQMKLNTYNRKYNKNTIKAYRGVSEYSGSNAAMYGLGLYTTLDKNYAKKYGTVEIVDNNLLPDNPLKFKTQNDFQMWQQDLASQLGIKYSELLGSDYGIEKYVIKLGYDGLEIGTGKDTDIISFKDNKYSIEDKANAWQSRLNTVYKNKNKGTTIKELKTPILDYLDNRKINYEVDEYNNITSVENKEAVGDFYNKKHTKIPTKEAILKAESKKEEFDRYKKNLVKANEKTINDLISYKNETSRSLESKIAEKQKLLDKKQNKDTKVVATIRTQIENLKLQKTNVESLYNEKIDKFNSKLSKEKIELEVRNTIKQEARNSLKAEIDPLIQDLTKYKDKKNGLRYNRETAQRNIDDIVIDKELATAIKETVFDPVQVHQAEKTREINELSKKIDSLELDKNKKYYYVPEGEIVGIKIDEATLAQLIIERKINDTDLRNYGINDEGIKKIHTTANTFNEILDYLYDRMNEEQIKYGYSPIGKIENYFPHIFENKPDRMLSKIASYFGIDLTKQELPTEIAGKTDTFKPGEVWNSNLKKRMTNKTDYDALLAMEKYINGACEIIHTTEDIQRVREYSRQIRYKFSDEGMQKEIDKIINNTEITQEAKDMSLEGIFRNTSSELSNFVTWLDDYANTLAGKKALSDRSIEHNIGRNVYSSMSGIESRIAANTIGGNLSVSFTNFAPIFQASGTTKWNYLVTGMLQTAQNDVKGLITKNKDTSFVSNSNFLTNRFGTDTISKKKVSQKVSDILSIPMNAIDEFTSESIVRAKYLENLDKGMSEEIALDKADKYAAKLMADRSKGALPLIFNAKNPLSKLATMFQVEPNNIVSNYLKDMPRDAGSKKQLAIQATKLMVASYAFNTVMMGIRGRKRSTSRSNKMGILFNSSNYWR